MWNFSKKITNYFYRFQTSEKYMSNCSQILHKFKKNTKSSQNFKMSCHAAVTDAEEGLASGLGWYCEIWFCHFCCCCCCSGCVGMSCCSFFIIRGRDMTCPLHTYRRQQVKLTNLIIIKWVIDHLRMYTCMTSQWLGSLPK